MAVELNDLTFHQLKLPPTNISTGCDENCDSPKTDCAAVELNDLTFRRLRLPPENVSAGLDRKYDSTRIDSAAVELNYLLYRRLSSPPEEIAVDGETAAVACGSVQQDDTIFRHTNWPPDEFAAGRNDDYIGRDLWTGPSVCIQPVTGSLDFGSSQRLGRYYLWRAAFPSRGIESAEVPLIPLLLLVVSGKTICWLS